MTLPYLAKKDMCIFTLNWHNYKSEFATYIESVT